MNLYDAPADVVRKAIRGLGLLPEDVAIQAGIPSRDLAAFLADQFSPDIAQRIAPPLGLNPDALSRLPDYQPDLSLPDSIDQLSLPFEDEEVNVWMIGSGESRLVIDCGFRPGDLSRELRKRDPVETHLLITHAHRDHLGGLEASAPEASSITAPRDVPGASTIEAGDIRRIGPFTVRAFDLSGHHPNALGYRIEAPELQAIAVGDAVFAGSIGGCPNPVSYARARQTIEAALDGVPPERILLTGHGPATTLGNERVSNPFLSAWL